MNALVIGGTGPSGPAIVNGLLDRGFETIVLHRGTHEVEFDRDIEHIHVDPHFSETLEEGLGDRTFEVVIGSYGRLRLFPDLFRRRTDRLITIGGTLYANRFSRLAKEDDPRLTDHKLYRRILETEDVLFEAHSDGFFNLTHFRYPNLYGPRQLAPREWSIIRRILDGRRRFIVLDGGLTLESRSFVEHAADAVLLGVDQPDNSAGQAYSVVDEHTPSDADRIEMIAAIMGVEIELVSFPVEAGLPAWYWGVGRSLTWSREGDPPPTEHQLIDVSKMRDELGYRDKYSFEEAYRLTVEWYLEHPPERGGEEERQLGDPFDYEAEDAFMEAQGKFIEMCRAVPFDGVAYDHPYAHPKSPATDH